MATLLAARASVVAVADFSLAEKLASIVLLYTVVWAAEAGTTLPLPAAQIEVLRAARPP